MLKSQARRATVWHGAGMGRIPRSGLKSGPSCAAVLRLSCVLAAVLAAAGCPLPFQFSPAGWPAAASAADPSTPAITAAPVAVYSQAGGSGGTLSDGQSASTSSDTTIVLATDTAGAIVYYTTDGSTPDPRSAQTTRYLPSSPISLGVAGPTVSTATRTISLKATAIGPNMKPSLVTSVGLTVQYPQADAPAFSLVPGTAFTTDQTLTLATSTPGAEIYYTVVAGAGPAPRPVPGQAGTVAYSGPIALTGPTSAYTFSAIAIAAQMIDSVTASASYSVTYAGLAIPLPDHPAGAYTDGFTLNLSSPGSTAIWYTTDGSTPVPNVSPQYPAGGLSMPLAGSGGIVTLRAVATAPQMVDSPGLNATYTFVVAPPSASVPTGVYNTVLSVSLSTPTPGAVVYYTTDGSAPTQSSHTAQPVTVGASLTLWFIAFRPDFIPSGAQNAVYSLVVAPVNFSPVGGLYPTPISLTLTDASPGAAIEYSLDGGSSWIAYGSPIALSANGMQYTVLARAGFPGFVQSAVTSQTYGIAAPPSGLMVGHGTSSSIVVQWATVPGAVQYVIQRDTSLLFTSPMYLYAANTSTSITDSGLMGMTTYYYRIRADYPSLSSDFTAPIQAATLQPNGMPFIQSFSVYGLPAATVIPPGGGNYWRSCFQPGWIAGGYRYMIWHYDAWNSLAYAIVAYDSAGAIAGQWMFTDNRYITGVGEDGNGNILVTGQYGTTAVPWGMIQM
jgi:hypothetical protein